ncbi:hypothetical protein GCM10010222_74650 [Streptomyces tanashiensis]|nr:hypothetical protein GCM10010222_74650 [Streptomyces tanashiensis]
MRTSAGRGRVYRRCGCRDTHRHWLGARCPHLIADGTHGTWGFAVDVPAPEHRRTTVQRRGFTSQDSAEEALRRLLEGEAGGFDADPNQTVAAYLDTWLAAKTLVLKPTTMARYQDYVATTWSPHSAPSSSNSSNSSPTSPTAPSRRRSVRTGPCGCDHRATTSAASAQPSSRHDRAGASISGAEVGCRDKAGSACSMAAGAPRRGLWRHL